MESSFAEVAKYAGPIGLVLFLLFALVKGLLALKIFSQITSEHTFSLLNKLINVVLIISMVAIIASLIEKCSPSIGGPPRQVDNNIYTITFDEIAMIYMPLRLPNEMKDYRICFEARSGNDIINKEIDKPLSGFVPERGLATPISLRGLQIKNVKAAEGCTLRLGFDPTMTNACAENADIVFKFEIGKEQFDYASHGGTMPLQDDQSNFHLDIKYKIIKQNE